MVSYKGIIRYFLIMFLTLILVISVVYIAAMTNERSQRWIDRIITIVGFIIDGPVKSQQP